MCSLERPDTLTQPIEEWQIVCHSSKEGLAEMNMSLHEAGHNQATAGVDDACPTAFRRATDRDDAITSNPYRGAEYLVLRVDTDEGTSADQEV